MKSQARLWPLLAAVFALLVGAGGLATKARAQDAPAAPATPAAADAAPAAAVTPAPAPAAPQNSARMQVVLVVSDELRSSKWGEKSWGGKGVNNLSDAIISHATAMLGDMGADVRTATPSDRIDGAQYYVTPVIKRAEQALGMFAWSKDRYTLVLEWRVTDAKGSTVLLDTVIGEGTGAGGNAFSAHDQAIKIFKALMDDTFAKSRALLTPALAHS